MMFLLIFNSDTKLALSDEFAKGKDFSYSLTGDFAAKIPPTPPQSCTDANHTGHDHYREQTVFKGVEYVIVDVLEEKTDNAGYAVVNVDRDIEVGFVSL